MAVPSPNILLALFIVSFSLSAIFHRSSNRASPSNPAPPSVFSHYAADILVPSTNDTFSSRPAAFGAAFDDVLTGELVKGWGDGLACQNFSEMKAGSSPFKGKIVLVQRGKCAFADKVRRVQAAGGIAVVVGDNSPTSGLLTMFAKGDTSDITIPSTFIPHTSYLSLSFLLSSPPLTVSILPSTASDWPLLDTLLLVVLSPIFTLACIYILLLLRRRVQRRRELAPLSVVKSLPKRKWTREKDPESTTAESSTIPQGYGTSTSRAEVLECVVCLEDFVEGDIVITLPCHHEFHEACITPWLTTRRRLCPICKRDIITPEQGESNERSPLLQNAEGTGASDWRGETAGAGEV